VIRKRKQFIISWWDASFLEKCGFGCYLRWGYKGALQSWARKIFMNGGEQQS
jgi:hypothetical protein